MRHTFEAHSSVPNFRFTCRVEGCCQTFTTYSAIKSHLARKHRGADLDEAQTPIQTQESQPDGAEFSGFQLTDDDASSMCQEAVVPSESSLQRSATLFLLSLKEEHQNTQKAVDFAVGQVQTYAVEDTMASVLSVLQEHAVTGSDLPDVSSCYAACDPFATLHTEYLQTKYYVKHFNLVVSPHACACVSCARYTCNIMIKMVIGPVHNIGSRENG